MAYVSTPRGILTPTGPSPVQVASDLAAMAESIDNAITDALDPLASLPYAVAAGTMSFGQRTETTANWSTTISFPAGRFAYPPIVTVTPMTGGAAASCKTITYDQVTSGGFRVYFWADPGQTVQGKWAVVSWTAVQMTPTNGAG